MAAAARPAAAAVGAIEPTDEQRAIVASTARTIVVAANAGAAKTTTLALRIGAALRQGVAPQRLLALTFTAPACEALAAALKKVGAPPLPAGAIRTFDDFAASVLLGVEGRAVPRLATPEALAPYVRQAIVQLDLPADDGLVERFLQVARRLKGTLARDRMRRDGLRLDADSAEDLGVDLPLVRLFDAYEAIRFPPVDGCDRPRFRAEFDAAYDLARLLADPDAPEPATTMSTWPRRVEQLLVDEMHDLNEAAFTILRALLQDPSTRFCGVGDVDQVVHQTHGAERRFMEPGVELGAGRTIAWLPLTASRRFGAGLAAAAGAFARKPYATGGTDPTTVDAIGCGGGARGGAAAVVEAVRRATEAGGRRASSVAVLLRHPSQSVAIENALLEADIGYVVRGFESYLLQDEVLLVRALLALGLHDVGSLASEATRRRLVRAVVFFCGVELDFGDDARETPEERLAEAVRHVARDAAALEPFLLHQVLRRCDPRMAGRLGDALRVVGSASVVPRPDTPASAAPGDPPPGAGGDILGRLLAALQVERLVPTVFVEKARRADALDYLAGLVDAARGFDGPHDFAAALNRAETRFDGGGSVMRDARRAAGQARRAAITLSTIPAAKGLEFDHVIVPYLDAGRFPAAQGGTAVEERNLFYVAITRARRSLTLIADASRPSPFVAAAGLALHAAVPAAARRSRPKPPAG